MKKFLVALLVISLAANAALVAHLVAPRLFATRADGAAASPTRNEELETRNSPATTAVPTAAELAALQDKLLSLGIPPDTAHEILRAILLKPLRDRQRALLAAKTAGIPYWQQNPDAAAAKYLTTEQRAELRVLSDQIDTVATQVLGAAGVLAAGNADRYAFLPADKAAALAPIDRDYAAIRADLRAESAIFPVAFDANLRKLILDEQRRDLEATLTPQELADYDLRYSPAALDLRKRFAALPDSTEAEYRSAYDLTQKISAATDAGNPDSLAAAQQQLRDLLGPDRYAAFQRAGDPDYTALQNAAARFNISTDAINKVYDLRASTASLSQQIATDSTLTPEDRQDALRALADQVRNDIRASLGDDVAAAYLKNNMTWLNTLSEGEPVKQP